MYSYLTKISHIPRFCLLSKLHQTFYSQIQIINLDHVRDVPDEWFRNIILSASDPPKKITSFHSRSSAGEWAAEVVERFQTLEVISLPNLDCETIRVAEILCTRSTQRSVLRVLDLGDAIMTSSMLITIAMTNPHLEELCYGEFDRTLPSGEDTYSHRTAWIRAAQSNLLKLKYLCAPLRSDVEIPLLKSCTPKLIGLRLIREYAFPGTDEAPPTDYDWDDYYDMNPPRPVGEFDVDPMVGDAVSVQRLEEIAAQLPVGVGLNVIVQNMSPISYVFEKKVSTGVKEIVSRGFRLSDPFLLRYADEFSDRFFSYRMREGSLVSLFREMISCSFVPPTHLHPRDERDAALHPHPQSLWILACGTRQDSYYAVSSREMDLFRFIFEDCVDLCVLLARVLILECSPFLKYHFFST
jgi:hypothetical protein